MTNVGAREYSEGLGAEPLVRDEPPEAERFIIRARVGIVSK